ncbi:MAG: hypothetical protein ACE14L_13635 [Terriglobales bacterium]
MFLLGAIFIAGLLHGFGPDHLAAITAFGATGERNARRVLFFSTRFALGHAVVIAGFGVLAKFGRLVLPPAWEHAFELAAGWLLILSGVALGVGLLTGRLSLHAHPHVHQVDAHSGVHKHVHLHWLRSQAHQHRHGSFAAALGALFALGGVRGLLAVVPIALADTIAVTLLRIGTFALGIIVAMVGYGLFAQRLLTSGRSPAFARTSCYVAALFCLVAGVLLIQGRI